MLLFRSKTQEENQNKYQWDQDTDEAQCEEELCHYHEGCKKKILIDKVISKTVHAEASTHFNPVFISSNFIEYNKKIVVTRSAVLPIVLF